MASSTLPWERLWQTMWGMIVNPSTDGRVIVALDDTINPKTGKKIFACSNFHNHAANLGESLYPWSQCIVQLGLLQKVKDRWACLPLGFKFYFMQKDLVVANDDKLDKINSKQPRVNAKVRGKLVKFATKLEQSSQLVRAVYSHFKQPLLIVADSWFGNGSFWRLLDSGCSSKFNLLSRLRCNNNLYAELNPNDQLSAPKKKRGRPKKYGKFLGNVTDFATVCRDKACDYSIFLYGKKRKVLAYEQQVMLKTLKCKVRVVFVYRGNSFISLFTTDLSLSVERIIEYYGARWKIESGFKELKQEIGSARAQVRDAYAVSNHLQFCMMATTLSWIYASRTEHSLQRKHKVNNRSSFAFSDIRREIAKVVLSKDFHRLCTNDEQTLENSFAKRLLQLVA